MKNEQSSKISSKSVKVKPAEIFGDTDTKILKTMNLNKQIKIKLFQTKAFLSHQKRNGREKIKFARGMKALSTTLKTLDHHLPCC